MEDVDRNAPGWLQTFPHDRAIMYIRNLKKNQNFTIYTLVSKIKTMLGGTCSGNEKRWGGIRGRSTVTSIRSSYLAAPVERVSAGFIGDVEFGLWRAEQRYNRGSGANFRCIWEGAVWSERRRGCGIGVNPVREELENDVVVVPQCCL